MLRFLLVIWIIGAGNCYAQQFVFKHYGVEEGLCNSTVYEIKQDKKGYIWAGTETGLCKFDGYNFKTYGTNDGLTDNTILSVYPDRWGKIWMVSLSRRISYLYNERVIHFDTVPILAKIRFSECREDNQGNIYAGNASSEYITKITPEGKIELLSMQTSKGGKVWGKNNRGDMYIGLTEQIACIRNNKIQYIPIKKDFQTKTFGIGGLVPQKREGILYFNNEEVVWMKDSATHITIFEEKHHLNSSIVNLVEDADGHIWILTSGGAHYMGANIESPTDNVHVLPEKYITSAMTDHESGLWFATLGEGVYFLPSKYIKSYTTLDGLTENKLNCLTVDKYGTLWIGGNNGNIYSLIADSIQYRYKPEQIKKSRIFTLFSDGREKVWCGTDKGSYTFDKHTVYDTVKQAAVKSIYVSDSNVMYVGTSSYMTAIELNNNVSKIIKNTDRVTAVYVDKKQNVWYSESNGLWKYDGVTNSYIGLRNELLQQRISYIRESDNGMLWLATQGNGLLCYYNNKVKQISEKDGIIGNWCTGFYIDNKKHTIWVGTNKGMSRIKFTDAAYNKFEVFNINSVHGLISNEINSVYKTGDTVWAATNSGLSFFDENKLNPNRYNTEAYISRISISGKDTLLNNKMYLPYNENNILIEFVGLSFRNFRKNKFRYRLLGANPNWVTTTSHIAQFPNLPPGNYTFMVKAYNEDNLLSNKTTSINFIINPPYWATWWFRLLLAGIFISTVAGYAYFKVTAIRKEEQQKTAYNKKIAELKAMALQAQMNPHFIYNSLNSIQDYILTNDKDHASKYLSEFSKLMRMIMENASYPEIALSDEIDTLKLYLSLEAVRLEDKFDYEVTIGEGIDIYNDKFPPLLVQPMVENAIWHGIANSNRRGKIEILFEKDNETIKCTIRDNGIGRAKAQEYNKNLHPSRGSYYMKERLELLNSQYNGRQSVIYHDLTDHQGNATGTEVILIIPTEKD